MCDEKESLAVSSNPVTSQWADQRGFRPAIAFSEASSVAYQRRFLHVPGLYLLLFANDEAFLGMSDDLGTTLGEQPQEWHEHITGVRVMARSKKGLELIQDVLGLQREMIHQGIHLRPRPHRRTL